jgi:hypothetical protein
MKTKLVAIILLSCFTGMSAAQESVNLEQFTWITDMGEFLTKKANIGWVYDELTQKR